MGKRTIQDQIFLCVRWLITIVFNCAQVVIPIHIIFIDCSEYDLPNFQYDDANVFLQTMLKTPVAVS